MTTTHTSALARKALQYLRRHCTIHDITLTDSTIWELEYHEIIDEEWETRGPDGPYMRERTYEVGSTDYGNTLEELLDALARINDDDNLTYMHVHLPAQMAGQLQ